MKFSRLFYDSSINFNKVSSTWIVISIVIGLLSALTIYSFFYVIRESFRVMTFGFANLPYIISKEDRNLYNIFFAGLSLIFANSITINMLFSKPSKIISRTSPNRKRILNDQIFLSFNFSYWFTKMGLGFFALSMCCMDFHFSPYVGVLSTLLLTVLYLESWKGLIRVLKKNRFIILLSHIAIMLLLTLGLSRIDLIDYKSIDKLAVESSSVYALPHSDFYHDLNLRNYPEITISLELKDDGLEVWHYGKRASIYELPLIVASERASMREELIPFFRIRISANKYLQLKYIKTVEAVLYNIGQRNIIYDIYNEDLLSNRFERRRIKYRITSSMGSFKTNFEISMPPSPALPDQEAFINNSLNFRDTLSVSIGNTVKVNGFEMSQKRFVEKFKKYIKPNVLFQYSYDNNATYQDYITVLSSHTKAMLEMRKSHQTIFMNNRYDVSDEYRKEQRKLIEQFPIQLIEKFNEFEE